VDLQDYYRLIRRNLVLILLFVLLGIGAAAGITFTQTPQYQADAQLFVSTPASAIDISALAQGSSFTQQRVVSYAQIINGPRTLDAVIKKLGLNISEVDLAKKVKATAPLNTVLINVSVTDPNPVLAAKIANAIGAQFSSTVNLLEQGATTLSDTNTIKVSVVKYAVAPLTPSSPKKTINLLLGLILGFGVGLGLALVRAIFDTTVKNESDLDETPLLAAFAYEKIVKTKPLISQISKWAGRTESFRQLRTSIQYLTPDNPPKVISITSAFAGEGKTNVAVNLALSLVQSGHRTILIEGDLRRPKIFENFGLKSKHAGFSELLAGRISINVETALAKAIDNIPEHKLSVIATGHLPPNPAELLDSDNFRSVLALLREQYDYIIIDTPPILLVADAQVMAPFVDGTILVVRAGKTRKNQYLGARQAITSVGGKVLGVVLNQVPNFVVQGDYGYKYSGDYKGAYGYGRYRYRRNKYYSRSGYSNEIHDEEKKK
jgi:non-specific protein-tyrosine kinase